MAASPNLITLDIAQGIAAKAKNVLARRDLPTYVDVVHGLPTYKHMGIWAKYLMDDSIKKLCIIAPPGHAKTYWSSIFFPAWYLGNHPERHILFLSNTADQALKPAMSVRDTISGNPAYHQVFPKIKPNPDKGWGQMKFYIERPDTADKDPSFLAAGIFGPILGARADLLILDDVTDAEIARTRPQRMKLSEWITQTAFSRLVKGGRVVSIATRFAEEDLSGEFISDAWHPETNPAGWVVIHMPAIGNWGPETALCPQIMPLEELLQKKAALSRGGSTLWEGMYQGNPTVPEGNIIKHAWWKYMPLEQFPAQYDMYIQVWDTAFKTGEENDYCVGLGIGLYKGHIFIREMMREKMAFPELLIKSRFFYDHAPTKPRLVLVEDKASGQSMIQVFKTGTGIAGVTGNLSMLPVYPVKADNDPIARVTSVSGFIESGRVFLPTEGPITQWVKVFTDEVEGFPTKAHDDITMALVHGLNYLTKGDKFNPLESGSIVSTAEPSAEATLEMGWGDLPGAGSLGDFLRELS